MSITPKREQVGGTHYAALEIHPDHFAAVNGWDPCAFSVLKYITRHGAKNGREDVQKAIDFVARRQVLLVELAYFNMDGTPPNMRIITANEYCRRNGIGGSERMAIQHLEEWVCRRDDKQRAMCVSFLDDILARYDQPRAPGTSDGTVSPVRFWYMKGNGAIRSIYRQPPGQPKPDEGYVEVTEAEFLTIQNQMYHGVSQQ